MASTSSDRWRSSRPRAAIARSTTRRRRRRIRSRSWPRRGGRFACTPASRYTQNGRTARCGAEWIRCSSRAATRERPLPMPGCGAGCGASSRACGASAPFAPAPSSSPRRGCSTAAARRRTGAPPTPWRGSSRTSGSRRTPLYVCDGGIYTSAGVTAGMDLALALVEEDLGGKLALEVARGLVLFLKRPGGQSQFSSHLAAQAIPRGRSGICRSGCSSTSTRT